MPALLLLSTVLFFSAPSVSSQLFTTSTTMATSTLTLVSSQTVNYITTQTSMVTTAMLTMRNGPCGLTRYVEMVGWLTVTVPMGVQEMDVDYSSSVPVDIWVFRPIMYAQFMWDIAYRGANPCDRSHYAIQIVSMERQGSAVVGHGLLLPATDVASFDIWIVYRAPSDKTIVVPTVTLSLDGVQSIVTLTSTAVHQIKSAKTFTYYETKELPQTPFSGANGSLLLPAAIVALLATLLLAAWLMIHRKKVRRTRVPRKRTKR
jgi:hypothetical protein